MQLQRLTSPNICSDFASWGSRKANGLVFSLSSNTWNLGKANVSVWVQDRKSTDVLVQDCQTGKSSLTQVVVRLLVLSRPSTDWLRLTHITVCFIQSTDVNVNFIPKHPHRNIQNKVCPNIWALHCPVKLAHRINHHSWYQRCTRNYSHLETAISRSGWSRYTHTGRCAASQGLCRVLELREGIKEMENHTSAHQGEVVLPENIARILGLRALPKLDCLESTS